MQQLTNTLTYAALGTVKTTGAFAENGILIGFTIVLPNFETAATAVVKVLDDDGYTVYTSGNQSENATTTTMGLTIPMDVGYTLSVTLNAAVTAGDVAGGVNTAVVKVYIKKD